MDEFVDEREKRKFGNDENTEGEEASHPEKKKLNQLAEESDDLANEVGMITASMNCPSARAGLVIGKKGTNINEIMARSKCKVVVDQHSFDGGPTRKVSFTGSPEGIAIAMGLVQRVINDGPQNVLLCFSDSHVPEKAEKLDSAEPIVVNDGEIFMCPFLKCGTVIGPKGRNQILLQKLAVCFDTTTLFL